MPLTLRIISPQQKLLGAESTKVFSVHGGTIGRAPDNDWVLPDPDRYVSAHHAIIDYQGGAYYLTDTSSNGVFVNDSDQPVGSGAPIRLHNGDRLRMGRYRFAVSIVNVGRAGTGDTGIFAADGPAGGAEADAPPGDLELVDDAPAPPAAREVRETTPLTILEPLHELAATGSLISPAPMPDETAPVETASAADATAETQPVEALQQAALREALERLLGAGGLDAGSVPAGSELETLTRLGRLLRASVGGLARALIRSERPASSATGEPATHNPLTGSDDETQAVHDLIFGDPAAQTSATEAVHEAVADLLAHQVALARAARAAWLDLLDRMAPATLEAGFGRSRSLGALLGMSGNARNWDRYRRFYEELAQSGDERFEAVFEQTYRRIYKAERERQAFREQREAPARSADG